jgi:hypothetical protein
MNRERQAGSVRGVVLLPTAVRSSLEGYDGEMALKDAGVYFHSPLEDCPRLRFAELPAGWKTISTNAGRTVSVKDARGRVRATIRQDWVYSGPVGMRRVGFRFVVMTVACPFILSMQKAENLLIPRIRKRYDGEVMAMPPIPWEHVENRNAVKAQHRAFLLQWLNEAKPGWKYSAKYWESSAA